jgi:hypothetical protein
MNFDISDRPIKMIVQGEGQLLILQSDNGQFYPAFGMNRSGTFMNLLMVDPNEEGMYRRGKNCVHIMRLFEDILSEKIGLSALGAFLDNKAIVNVPSHSVHSMIAGKNRRTVVVEPGRGGIDMNEIDPDFMVLTNFSLSENRDRDYKNVTGPGSDRYQRAYETLTAHKESFTRRKGFDLLKETVQHSGDFPTRVSLIFIPEEGRVYFTLHGDFTKIFKFSFATNQIETEKGFTNPHNVALTKKGVLLSELQSW